MWHRIAFASPTSTDVSASTTNERCTTNHVVESASDAWHRIAFASPTSTDLSPLAFPTTHERHTTPWAPACWSLSDPSSDSLTSARLTSDMSYSCPNNARDGSLVPFASGLDNNKKRVGVTLERSGQDHTVSWPFTTPQVSTGGSSALSSYTRPLATPSRLAPVTSYSCTQRGNDNDFGDVSSAWPHFVLGQMATNTSAISPLVNKRTRVGPCQDALNETWGEDHPDYASVGHTDDGKQRAQWTDTELDRILQYVAVTRSVGAVVTMKGLRDDIYNDYSTRRIFHARHISKTDRLRTGFEALCKRDNIEK